MSDTIITGSGPSYYGARENKAWESHISAQITVGATAASLKDLVEAVDLSPVYTDEDANPTVSPDGSTQVFSGTISKDAYTQLKPSSITITATVSSSGVDITDDGSGGLSGTNVTGTIDYETGEWSVEWSSGAPDDASSIVVDYTLQWFYPSDFTPTGLWLSPADTIYVTLSGKTNPTSSSGMEVTPTKPIFLAGQPTLIENMILVAGADVLVDVEIMT